MPERPSLRQLLVSADPGAWAALGFAVQGERCRIGDVELVLGSPGDGMQGWVLVGDGAAGAVDGLPTRWLDAGPVAAAGPHPNGAVSLDHVVVLTNSLSRTAAALLEAGLTVSRVREAGEGRRQAFIWLGERQLLLEVVEAPGLDAGHAAFWGVTIVVADLDAAASRLGPWVGPIRDAVQPGRRIATVSREALLGVPVALITPHV